MDNLFDCIIIGGGAAGLFCASIAGKRGKKVLILEHNDSVGKKIRISGGGRCNFTNLHCSPKSYISNNKYFATSALSRYTQHHFIELVEQYNIAYHEKTLGQLFCDNSSKDIIGMLLRECEDGNVQILLSTAVHDVQKHDSYHIYTSRGEFIAETVVIASGGLSIPKLGATNFAYQIAEQFQIPLITPQPALVPLIFGESDAPLFTPLSGLSVEAEVSCNGITFAEGMLFTHRGISGPAILQISSYWNHGDPIAINFLPSYSPETLLPRNRKGKLPLKTYLTDILPKRLAQTLASSLPDKNLADLSNAEMSLIVQELLSKTFFPTGTEGFAKAEVTSGGVNTNALSSKTMEVKQHSGLFFIGEAVDVTGWLGGYNFQWAWSSGYATAMAL